MAETPPQDGRTLAPSEKRLRDAEERGDLLWSVDVATLCLVVSPPLLLWFNAQAIVAALGTMIEAVAAADAGAAMVALLPLGQWLIAVLLAGPALLLVAVLLMRGGRLRIAGLRLRPEALDIAANARRLLGRDGQQPALLIIARLLSCALLAALALALPQRLASISPNAPLVGQVAAATQLLTAPLAATGTALLLLAALGAFASWILRQRRLRMTLTELRDELKSTDGNPEVRMQRRSRRRAQLRGALLPAIRKADVVVSNPVHFAVALAYRPERDAAPVVVARARAEQAAMLRQLALERAVPAATQPMLARALYFGGRVGQTIPPPLFMAVARLLAVAARLDQALTDLIELDVPDDYRFDERGRRVHA